VDIGIKTMFQVFYGQIDLGIHDGQGEQDLDAALRRAYVHTGMPYPDGTFLLSGFGHPMGGYDAGYYGYLWSEVIGDDLFSRFEREGVTSPAVGADYRREILEKNGSRPAAELVHNFLGRDFTPDAWFHLRNMDQT
jgi:Zn-dependent oligopeptidase